MKIRFRVWDGYKMWYPDEIGVLWFLSSDGTVCSFMSDKNSVILGEGFLNTNKKAVAMLSERFEDENGAEIWAGDICRHSIVGLMSVDSAVFQATRYIFPAFGKTVKVVGNKYENPELLKEVA